MKGRVSRAAVWAALGLAAVCSGCSSPGDRLIGKWKMDNQQMQQAIGSMGEAAGALGGFGGQFLDGLLEKVEVACEFFPSEKFAFKMNVAGVGTTKSGSWKLVSANGDELVVALDLGEGVRQQTITFVDADTIEMGLPSIDEQTQFNLPQTARFKRVVSQ